MPTYREVLRDTGLSQPDPPVHPANRIITTHLTGRHWLETCHCNYAGDWTLIRYQDQQRNPVAAYYMDHSDIEHHFQYQPGQGFQPCSVQQFESRLEQLATPEPTPDPTAKHP